MPVWVSKACQLFLVFPGTSSTPLSPPLVLEVRIVPQVPTTSALPHTWTLKWVYKELGSATIYLRLQTCWNGIISILNMLVDITTNMNTCSMLLDGEQSKVLSLHHVLLAFDFEPWFPPNVLLPCLVHSQVQLSHVALATLLTLYNLCYKLMYNLF